MKTNKFAQQGGKTTYDVSRIQAQVQANIQQGVQANLQSTATTTHSTPWRWKRTFSLALTAMLLFVVVVGVVSNQYAYADEPDASLISAPRPFLGASTLTEEKLLEIKQAYVDRTRPWGVKENIALLRYYGNFNGAEVVLLKDKTVKDDNKFTQQQVSRYVFNYTSSQREILVYHNSQLLTLQQAFEQNVLYYYDIGFIVRCYNGHELGQWHHVWADPEIDSELLQAFGSGASHISRYYGYYNGVHVFQHPFGEDALYTSVFHNVAFDRPASAPVYACKDGVLYTMDELVENGTLSRQDVYNAFSIGECMYGLVVLTEEMVDDMLRLYAQRKSMDITSVELGTIYTIIGENVIFEIKGETEGVDYREIDGTLYCYGYTVHSTLFGEEITENYGALYTLFVYNNGKLYTLQEALDQSVMTGEELFLNMLSYSL